MTGRATLLAALPLGGPAPRAAGGRGEPLHWPDNIPPEAKELLQPLPLSPPRPAGPGLPRGPAREPARRAHLHPRPGRQAEGRQPHGRARHAHHGRGLAGAAGRGHHQDAGGFGIKVVAVTDAKFEPGTQISDLEKVIARKPDVIFSIPIDPKSQSAAYKKAAEAGIKLVFMDNVPANMRRAGTTCRSPPPTTEERLLRGQGAGRRAGRAGRGRDVTLVYDYYYSSRRGRSARRRRSPSTRASSSPRSAPSSRRRRRTGSPRPC